MDEGCSDMTINTDDQGHIQFSVWVCFAEIYNEQVYDLLDPLTRNSKRKVLTLREDRNGNPYIKG